MPQIFNVNATTMQLHLPSDSIDLCITSPPYKTEEGYSDRLMHQVAIALIPILKWDALAFINFGHCPEDPLRFAKVALIFSEYLHFVQDIIWLKSFNGKGRFCPIAPKSKKNLNRMYEHLFVFANGTEYALDRLAVGCNYSDASNKVRFSAQHEGNNAQFDRCSGDVHFWPYENKTGTKGHKYKFPDALVKYCIKLSGVPLGASVLDPFAGGGTVLRVAEEMGRKGIGFDISAKWCEYIKRGYCND